MATVLYIMQHTRRVGRPEFIHPEEKRAKADSNCSLQLPMV